RLSAESGPGLALVGEDDRGTLWLYVYELRSGDTGAPEPRHRVPLPETVVGYDVAGDRAERERAVTPPHGILFLTGSGVLRWDPDAGPVPALEAPTIYRRRPAEGLVPVDFLRDVDGDGDLDAVLPDFESVRVVR